MPDRTFNIPVTLHDDGSADVPAIHVPAVIVEPPPPPPPPALLPPPNNQTATWANGIVTIMASPVPGAVAYPLHKGVDDGHDHVHDISETPPIATPSTPFYNDLVPQTNAVQTIRYCFASRNSAGADGDCAPDSVVTIPAAVVVPPPPPPPPDPSLPVLPVVNRYPNIASVVVRVIPFQGAKDYWCYDSANPGFKKASGGNTLMEWNGILQGDLIVEALDRLAPYQPAVQVGAGGVMVGNHHGDTVANGHGEPGSVPVVIARSSPKTITFNTPSLTGTQAKIDTFKNDTRTVTSTGNRITALRQRTSDGLWNVLFGEADFGSSNFAINMHDHMMTYLADGASTLNGDGVTPTQNGPLHNNNAWLAATMEHGIDFSGGRVAHFFTEVDAHFNARRWCDLWIIGAGDDAIDPKNFDEAGVTHLPNTSGYGFIWAPRHAIHEVFQTYPESGQKRIAWVLNTNFGDFDGVGATDQAASNRYSQFDGIGLNGTGQDIDLRHRFDLYLSENRCVGYETTADGIRFKAFDKPLPRPLGFTRGKLVLTHKVYHTANDINEVASSGKVENYWKRSPYGEIRHWGPTGAECLSSFPS